VRNRIVYIAALIFLGLAIASNPVLADVIPLSSLSLVGTSQIISGGTLRLTPNYDTDPSGPSPAGAAWTSGEYDVAAPFSVNFQFQMSDPCIGNGLNGTCIDDLGHGGDGIAFLIQNSAQGTAAIGEGAGGMGFLGITDSVAVMLDTYQNNSPNVYGDPSNNYISVNTLGTGPNVPHHFCMDVNGTMELTADPNVPTDQPDIPCSTNPTLGMTGYGGVPALPEDIDSGVHDIGITYNGAVLDIYLDSSLVLAVSIDLATTLNLQGGDDAFLGFTAGTRFAYQNQDILSFSEAPIPEPIWGQLWVPLAMLLVIALGRKWKRARS
jgi:hypothetical protein